MCRRNGTMFYKGCIDGAFWAKAPKAASLAPPKAGFCVSGVRSVTCGSGNEPGALREVVNWDCMGQTWANPRACRGVTKHRAE